VAAQDQRADAAVGFAGWQANQALLEVAGHGAESRGLAFQVVGVITW
jgi:hypothetical protein